MLQLLEQEVEGLLVVRKRSAPLGQGSAHRNPGLGQVQDPAQDRIGHGLAVGTEDQELVAHPRFGDEVSVDGEHGPLQGVGIDEIVRIAGRDVRQFVPEQAGDAVVFAVIIEDVGFEAALLQQIGAAGQIVRPGAGLLRPGVVAVEPLAIADEVQARPVRVVRLVRGLVDDEPVQAAGKAKIDVQAVPVDMLSISGHKFHAPKGIGFMYVRKGTKIKPFMLGGHQESGRRAGTENVPYIVGLAKACELARLGMADEERKLTALRDRLEAGILAKCPDVRVNGDKENRLPNTLNVSFEYIEGEAIAYHLSDLGICISTGSACASGSLDPSHVIRAMGVPFIAVHGSVRFSLSRYSTDEEVDYVLEKLPPVIANLRELSPFGPGKDVSTFK